MIVLRRLDLVTNEDIVPPVPFRTFPQLWHYAYLQGGTQLSLNHFLLKFAAALEDDALRDAETITFEIGKTTLGTYVVECSPDSSIDSYPR